jgi:hypothetical protein
MAYSNYRPQQGQSYGNGGGNGGGNFANGYNSNRGASSRGNGGNARGGNAGGATKKSGCKFAPSYTRRSTGEVVNAPVVTGWKKPAGQPFMKFVAVPHKDPTTKNPRWKKFVVTVQVEYQQEYLTTGFWDTDKKVLRMPDLNMVANPAGGPGGYWGRSGPPTGNRR